MSRTARRVAAPSDAKGRLVSIFVGAVLLPSIALSVVSFYAVPGQAEATKSAMRQRAEHTLSYIEEDLQRLARKKALAAAQVVGAERLLEGRPEWVREALLEAGWGDPVFESLWVEAASAIVLPGVPGRRRERDLDDLREAVARLEGFQGETGEVALAVTRSEAPVEGVLRFRFASRYVHGTLIREYFEEEFPNPDQAMVVRVKEPGVQRVVYETAPTPAGVEFEVKRVMTSPSFAGLKMYLRYKDRSIQQEVRRWALAKTLLIGFVDLMLGAGLFLVYSNVRREMHLAKQKSDFVANVSHELKTPLALIRLFAETLELGRVPGEEKALKYYRVINKESQRLTQLINNILDFSRIEAGRREYRLTRTDVSTVIAEVVEAYRFQVEQQGFTLEVDVEEGLPQVEIDAEALGQALINIVNNALKYSREEKLIRIWLRREDDRLLLSVADRGIGVAKSEQNKIFETFYRAEDSLVHETRGSGLGLALVRHIMEAHGGSVELESSPGRGSTFTLSLPLGRTALADQGAETVGGKASEKSEA